MNFWRTEVININYVYYWNECKSRKYIFKTMLRLLIQFILTNGGNISEETLFTVRHLLCLYNKENTSHFNPYA